jgi:ring-1,2-phenylacetyl-CoA epoxidase subunit PaaE
MERFQVYYILSREHNESPLLNGRLNGEKCEKFCQYFIDAIAVNAYFLCGPEEMIFSVKDTLNTLGVAKQNIHFELFTTSSAAEKTVKTNEAEQKTDKISEISIVLDGKTMTFPLAQQGKNILDAAMERGADLPYACKGGVCCTCKAKVTSGEVRMEVNYGLEEDEIAANYILTCQAHPISESVTVDFDV